MIHLEKLFHSICEGKAILLTGSGAHLGAIDLSGNPFPTGKDLAKHLYSKCGIENPSNIYDLADAATTFIEEHSERELITELKFLFSVSGIANSHKNLYNQNWKRIYTTNYDNIPVLATKDNTSRKLYPITLSERYSERILKKNICVYINGYIDKLDETTLTSEFKLTEHSYMKAQDFENSYWGKLFDEDLDTSDYVVVVGLSLNYDLDIKRLIFNKNIYNKIVFVENKAVNEDLNRKLSRLGTVLNIGAEEFGKQLAEYRDTHTFNCVDLEEKYHYQSFERFFPINVNIAPNTNVVYNFLMNGVIDNRLWYKQNGKYQGVVYRRQLEEVEQNILNGCLLTFVHGNLGNGKTVFLELLKRRLLKKGYTIYTYRSFYQGITASEIERITKQESKKIIIIENYYNYLNEIKQFSLHKDAKTQFVFTTRSVMFDVKFYDVCNYFAVKQGESQEYDLNALQHSELVDLSKLLSRNGLWSKYSDLSCSQKIKMLSSKDFGNGQFQGILIGLIKSTSIKRRFQEIITQIKSQRDKKFEVLILLLLIKVMSLDIKSHEVSKILDLNIAVDAMFKYDRNIQELLDFSHHNGDFKLKSSITAFFILQQLDCNETIISVLSQVSFYFNRYSNFERCKNVLKNIVSYSHLKAFLTWDSNKDEYIIEFYENIKTLEFYKENTFFWLQFAIVCMRFRRYKLAQLLLNTSYAYFNKVSDISPFQVDTQQANLYLLILLNERDCDIKELFLKAHELLIKIPDSSKDNQSKRLLLFGFYLKEGLKRKVKQAGLFEEYINCCRDAISRIQEYLEHANTTKEAKQQLKVVLAKLLKIVY